MQGHLYDGRVSSAYFIVQVLLTRQRTSLAWMIETMPVLEVEPGDYDLYRKRQSTYPFRDRSGLESLFIRGLTRDAGQFFEHVRVGEPLPEHAVPYGGSRTEPVV